MPPYTIEFLGIDHAKVIPKRRNCCQHFKINFLPDDAEDDS